MKLKLEITFTNLIGAIGFLYSVFNNFVNSEVLMYSVVLVLGRKAIPMLGDIAASIATIVTSKGKK